MAAMPKLRLKSGLLPQSKSLSGSIRKHALLAQILAKDPSLPAHVVQFQKNSRASDVPRNNYAEYLCRVRKELELAKRRRSCCGYRRKTRERTKGHDGLADSKYLDLVKLGCASRPENFQDRTRIHSKDVYNSDNRLLRRCYEDSRAELFTLNSEEDYYAGGQWVNRSLDSGRKASAARVVNKLRDKGIVEQNQSMFAGGNSQTRQLLSRLVLQAKPYALLPRIPDAFCTANYTPRTNPSADLTPGLNSPKPERPYKEAMPEETLDRLLGQLRSKPCAAATEEKTCVPEKTPPKKRVVVLQKCGSSYMHMQHLY